MNTGKVSGNILKRSVLRQIKTETKEVLSGAGIGRDCAIFSFSGSPFASCVQEAAVKPKTDTYVIPEDFGPCFTITQLILRCANNLAAAGAQPAAVMIALLLPETLEEAELKALMAEAEEACRNLSISIAGGQTRVLRGILTPMAVITGFGALLSGRAPGGCTVKAAAPGQDIIISKWLGLEGTALLACRYRNELLSRYPAYLVDEAAGFDRYLSILPEAAIAVESGVCAMHDASEGGIFAALWELAEGAGVGLTIDMKKLPLRQETVEVCEYCNVNPYELLSGGCLIMTAEDGAGLAAALKGRDIPAVIAGRITDSNDRLLLNGDEVRYMDRPKTDELYRVFSKSHKLE